MKLIDKLLGRNKIDEEEYPKYSNEQWKKVETTYTTYTLKIVWNDGSEDQFECDEYRIGSNGHLKTEYVSDFWTINNSVRPRLLTITQSKRNISNRSYRYWEVVDEQKKKVETEVKTAKKEYMICDKIRNKHIIRETKDFEVKEISE